MRLNRTHRRLADRLRQAGLVVYVTHDVHGCLRVATSVAPDVIVLDPRLPRRLARLLRAHPASGGALLRWTSDFAAPAPRRSWRPSPEPLLTR